MALQAHAHMLSESSAVLACLKFASDAAGTRARVLLVFADDSGNNCLLNW